MSALTWADQIMGIIALMVLIIVGKWVPPYTLLIAGEALKKSVFISGKGEKRKTNNLQFNPSIYTDEKGKFQTGIRIANYGSFYHIQHAPP